MCASPSCLLLGMRSVVRELAVGSGVGVITVGVVTSMSVVGILAVGVLIVARERMSLDLA